jgi:hypothetical protein
LLQLALPRGRMYYQQMYLSSRHNTVPAPFSAWTS